MWVKILPVRQLQASMQDNFGTLYLTCLCISAKGQVLT